MKIGLFFGSFNPIHLGHLIIADAALSLTDVDKILFVVSPQNPLKKKSSLAHEFDRYDMVRLAIADNPDFDLTDIEFQMPKPSYTIDTLARLTDKNPEHDYRLIMGGDSLAGLRKWKNHHLILNHYKPIVYPRPGSKINSDFDHLISRIEAPLIDISATMIRKRLRAGLSVRYLLPKDVENYLKLKKVYI